MNISVWQSLCSQRSTTTKSSWITLKEIFAKNAFKAWKHREIVENEIPDLPEGACRAHLVPFRQLCGIVLSAITNADVKNQVGTILQEAEKYTMSDSPAPATVQSQVDYDNIGGMPTPVPSMDGDGINGRTMDVDELFIPQSPTKYDNIGQYSTVRVDDDLSLIHI